MKQYLKFRFKTQILIYYILLIVFIIFAVMQLLYVVLKNSYRDMARSVLETQSKQIAINIDNKMNYYLSYSEMLLSNLNLIFASENSNFETVEKVLDLESARFIALNSGQINKIQIYRNGIFTNKYYDIQKIFDQFEVGKAAHSRNIFWTGTYLNDRNEKVISLFRRLYQTNPERVYLIEICIYETELFSLFSRENPDNKIKIIGNGEILSMSDREKFSESLYGIRKAYVGIPNTEPITPDTYQIVAECDLGWDIVISVGNEYLDQNFKKLYLGLIPIVLFVVLIASFFATMLSSRLNRRFSTLHEKIDLISQWDLSTDLRIQGSDEFSELSNSLEDTKQKIINLVTQIHDINDQKRIAEISALRAQINSHFLFNTLSSIKWLLRNDDKKSVADAIDKLAFLLRYSLSLDENQVLLENEVQQLNVYVYFQKQRYGGEINVNIDIDEELLNCKTVKLILQPLVENAIYHGKKEDDSQLNITVYTYFDDEFYFIVVEDDGNGITEGHIEKILNGETEEPSGSIGLANVIKRVNMCSDNQGKLMIESKVNSFTKITIRQRR